MFHAPTTAVRRSSGAGRSYCFARGLQIAPISAPRLGVGPPDASAHPTKAALERGVGAPRIRLWRLDHPRRVLRPGAICYCAGVGEDASFDLELIRHGCVVVSIDPTPRAIQYGAAIADRQPAFNLVPLGLWSTPTMLRFYAPRDPSHVSHSVVNLQGTAAYFEAECTTVRLLAEKLGHDHLDLLKLDIEGAEYEVITSVIRDGPLPDTICVEFDQPSQMRVIDRTVAQLRDAGYWPVAVDRWNVTFCRRP